MKRACKDLLKTWKKLEEGDKGGKEEISSSKKEEESQVKEPAKDKVKKTDFLRSGIPVICHGRHGQCPCKFLLAGVNFSRCNAND